MNGLLDVDRRLEQIRAERRELEKQLRAEPAVERPLPQPLEFNDRSQNNLRPMWFDDIIGQESTKAMMRKYVRNAREREKVLPHVLLTAAAGTGKTTFSQVIANEMGSRCYEVEAPVSHDVLVDLAGVMKDGDTLIVDEALDLATRIPTPAGWATVGDLTPGDLVLGVNGQPVKVRRLTPVQTPEVCYRVMLSDTELIVTDAGHKWMVQPKEKNGTGYLKPRVLTTHEMFEAQARDPKIQWRLPRVAPVELPEADLPLDPYILGQWLGNGNVGQVYINVRTELAEPTLERVRETLPDARYLDGTISNGSLRRLSLGRGRATGRGSGIQCQARRALEGLGVFHEKAIPLKYLRGSVEQRLDLLRGLMDSDGYLDKRGAVAQFCNTSENLIMGTMELLNSLGYVPRLSFNAPKVNPQTGKPYTPGAKVTFRARPDLNPFLVRNADRVAAVKVPVYRRITSIDEVEGRAVRCIEVDAEDHLFLAGPTMAPTHNCHQQAIRERRGKESISSPEVFLRFLEDFVLATSHGMIQFPRITVIGATTDPGMLPDPFIDRFPIQPHLMPYSEAELAKIALMNAERLGVHLDREAAAVFGRAAQVPRYVNRFMTNAAALGDSDRITADFAREIITDANNMTLDGLTYPQQRILKYLYQHAKRENAKGETAHVASLPSIATGIGLPRDPKSIQLRHEPQLISRGYIQMSSAGRMLTDSGINRARELLGLQ